MNVRTHVNATKPAQPAVSAGELELATPMPESRPQAVMAPMPVIKMYPPAIAKALLAITREIQPVTKAGFNKFHQYNYAKWEDILDELAPLIAKHGLIIQQSEIAHGGFASDLIEITYEFTIISEDGDVWPDRPQITSICKVRDQKGVLDDKASSKCFTQGQKYMMVGLFKIRTADLREADHDAGPQETRKAPSPSGKMAPHFIQPVDGETAQTWAKKLLGFLAKAGTKAECDKWDELNGRYIDMVQERDVDTYNQIVTALNRFNEPAKEDTAATVGVSGQPSGQTAKAEVVDDFPGDKPMQQQQEAKPNDDGLDIPAALRRAPSPPKKPALTDDERDWLLGLGGAFSGCEDIEGLTDEQDRLMAPHKERFSAEAWQQAESLLAEHIERVNEGG